MSYAPSQRSYEQIFFKSIAPSSLIPAKVPSSVVLIAEFFWNFSLKMAMKSPMCLNLTVIFLVLMSMLAISQATRKIVGGSKRWHFGFNYTDWAIQSAPFFQNDTLVFMYDPPNRTTFPHSVYLLSNHNRFKACDLRNAKLVANKLQGSGKGFEFVLEKRKHYYFACGERGGYHCKAGLMKFFVRPCDI